MLPYWKLNYKCSSTYSLRIKLFRRGNFIEKFNWAMQLYKVIKKLHVVILWEFVWNQNFCRKQGRQFCLLVYMSKSKLIFFLFYRALWKKRKCWFRFSDAARTENMSNNNLQRSDLPWQVLLLLCRFKAHRHLWSFSAQEV